MTQVLEETVLAMDSAALATAAFESAKASLYAEYKDVPDGETLIPVITSKLEATYTNPPIEDFEYGCRKVFTADELRVLLFNPQEEMIKYYPVMLTFVVNQPTPNNERIKGLLLSLIYLVHRRSWAFLEEFVLCGGLSALALLVAEPTLQLRGQVMEILLQITDCDAFDWFKKADSAKDTALHAQLLGLAESQAFLPGLLANRRESYPGGSLRALQILAFFVSWVRAMYTEDKRLVLGKPVLDELRLWSLGEGAEISEDESSLAATVHKDFAVDQFQLQDGQEIRPLPADSGTFLSGYCVPASGAVKTSPEEEEVPQRAPMEEVSSAEPLPLLDEVRMRREAGNASSKQGALEQALEEYAEALDLLAAGGGAVPPPAAEAREAEVSLLSNRAAVFWKMAKALQSDSGGGGVDKYEDDLDAQHGEDCDLPGVFELQRCEQACISALRLAPTHVKSAYRLVSTLLLLCRPEEGLAVADATLSLLAEGSTAESGSVDINGGEDKVEVLRNVRRKCVASLLLRECPPPGAAPLIDSRTSKVLSALQNRSRRERGGVSHPWNGFVPPEEPPVAATEPGVGGPSIQELLGEGRAEREVQQAQHKEPKKKVAWSASAAGAKKKKAGKKVIEAVQALRAASRAFDGGNADRASPSVASGAAALQVLCAEGTSLREALSCLEEPMVLLLVNVAVQQHAEGSPALAAETLLQLSECERFDTSLRLALFGQRELGGELLSAASACLGQEHATLLQRISAVL